MKITDIQAFPAGLAVKWDDDKDSFIEYKTLRDKCPCAHCSGEKDALGNLYIGANQKKTEAAYQLVNVIKVGHYAIQITWGDGHDAGIYTYEFLRKLNLSQ